MSVIRKVIKNEPLLVRAVIAVAAFAAAMGAPIEDVDVERVVEGIGHLVALVSVVSARAKVTPVAKLEEENV